MSELLTLKGTNGVSEIHIESGLLARAASVIGETFSPSRIHIVSDSTVAPLYLEQLEQQALLAAAALLEEGLDACCAC